MPGFHAMIGAPRCFAGTLGVGIAGPKWSKHRTWSKIRKPSHCLGSEANGKFLQKLLINPQTPIPIG